MRQELVGLVQKLANHRCEYCHFPLDYAWLPFQVDHIIAEKHAGGSELSNLALSCYYCNSFKGPNIAGINPQGQADVAIQLFHPRQDDWQNHFEWAGPLLIGKSPTGRATIAVLRINEPEAVEVRRWLLDGGSLR